MGKLDVLQGRDEVTVAFSQAADIRKEPGQLQRKSDVPWILSRDRETPPFAAISMNGSLG